MGSDDSEDEEEADADQLRDRYRSLLGLGEPSSNREGAKDWAKAKNQGSDDSNSDEEGSDDEYKPNQGKGMPIGQALNGQWFTG